MRRLLATALLLSAISLLVWRESHSGILSSAEQITSRAAARALGGGGKALDGVCLVVQGGISREELSGLDAALFIRAAQSLGARVAGVAAWRLPGSAIGLDLPAGNDVERRCSFVAGVLLTSRPGHFGVVARRIEAGGPELSTQSLPGSASDFPADAGWEGGFMNLPETAAAEALAPMVASDGENYLMSFSLAMAFAGHPAVRLGTLPGSGEPAILVAGGALAIRPDGNLPIDGTLLGKLHRVDMDDLLLEAERFQRGVEGDDSIRRRISGKTVLLGTLNEDTDAVAAAATRRRLSLAEYQALAILNILEQLAPPSPPLHASIAAALYAVLAGLLLWRVPPSSALFAAAGLAALWFLLAGELFVSAGMAVPSLPVVLVLLAALALRLLFKNHASFL